MKNTHPKPSKFISHFVKVSGALLAGLFASNVAARHLCLESEAVAFSMQNSKTGKFASVCKGKGDDYLVYRFGLPKKIELQFPSVLNESSWQLFTFYGVRRPGGKEESGFGHYWLSFTNRGTEYILFQDWNYEDDSYAIWLDVQLKGKTVRIVGNPRTQIGSLVPLDFYRERMFEGNR